MKVGDIMSKIDLIEFTDKKDSYELMYKWCSQEFVYEWFEQRKLSLEEIENKYKNKLLANQQHLFFIENIVFPLQQMTSLKKNLQI